MNDLTLKVVETLKANNISTEDMLQQLQEIVDDYAFSTVKKFDIIPDMLYKLKDTVWYNFEYLPSNEKVVGKTDLSTLGTVFPLFMFSFNNSNIIKHKHLNEYIKELDEIIKLFQTDNVLLANIFTKDDIDIRGGDKPSPVIIFRGNEHPSKYADDFLEHTSSFVDYHGDAITSAKKSYVLCNIADKYIDKYAQSNIFINVLKDLRAACKSAEEYDKDIMINFVGGELNAS
jgi:hypothetical protein